MSRLRSFLNGPNVMIMQLNGFGQPAKLLDQLARCAHQAAELDKSPHDLDVDPHSRGRVQDAGKHGHAMFCEHPRELAASTPARL